MRLIEVYTQLHPKETRRRTALRARLRRVESFNGRFRDECLNEEVFTSRAAFGLPLGCLSHAAGAMPHGLDAQNTALQALPSNLTGIHLENPVDRPQGVRFAETAPI